MKKLVKVRWNNADAWMDIDDALRMGLMQMPAPEPAKTLQGTENKRMHPEGDKAIFVTESLVELECPLEVEVPEEDGDGLLYDK